MREALQMDNQVVRRLPDLHLLVCGHVVFTLAAVPFVIAGQSLFDHKVVQAVIDRDTLRVGLDFEATLYSLVLIDGQWFFYELQIGLRITAPLGHENQVSILKLVKHLTNRDPFIDQV